MVTEEKNIIKTTETAVKEERLKRLQKKQKELLFKLKTKKQKLASLESNIESYRYTVFAAITEARGKIMKLQEELKAQFQALRKAKLLTSTDKKKLRELEMAIMPAEPREEARKKEKRGADDSSKGSSAESDQDTTAFVQEHVPKKDDRQLRKVFLRLAAVIHPDKASSAEEAGIMHELMQRVNAAYKTGDIAALLEIEQKYTHLLGQDKGIKLGSVDYLQKLIDQVEQEVLLLQTQLDKVKLELSILEKSDLGRMYKDFVRMKKYYKDPLKLITGQLHETIEYLVGLKNSVTQFLETGIMPPELEEELYEEEEDWVLDELFDVVGEDEDEVKPTARKKTNKSN